MKTKNDRQPRAAKQPRINSKADPVPQSAALARPAGKLGEILGRVASKNGATADELVTVTGWQRHSVLGAVSRLKARGFAIRLDTKADRKSYRLGTAG